MSNRFISSVINQDFLSVLIMAHGGNLALVLQDPFCAALPLLICAVFPSPSAQPVLYWCSRNMSVWSNICFNLALLMNLLVCLFYPLEGVHGGQWRTRQHHKIQHLTSLSHRFNKLTSFCFTASAVI